MGFYSEKPQVPSHANYLEDLNQLKIALGLTLKSFDFVKAVKIVPRFPSTGFDKICLHASVYVDTPKYTMHLITGGQKLGQEDKIVALSNYRFKIYVHTYSK
jgi:hypothetical protein